SRLFERFYHSRGAPLDAAIVEAVDRRVLGSEISDGLTTGGCADVRSHPGESFTLVLRSAVVRLRRPWVLTERFIVLPQKQVGSAPFGARPIMRKRISAPQERFGLSHHSSRLFFTNAPSARFNA